MGTAGELRRYLTAQGYAEKSIRQYVREALRAEEWCGDHGFDLMTISASGLVCYSESRIPSHATQKVIRCALRHWWDANGRRNPPWKALRVPRKPQMVCKALDEEPAQLLARVALRRGDRRGLVVLFALYLALRRSEIAAARWDGFDDGWYSLIGKGNKPATLPVHPILLAAMDRVERDGPWVFPGRIEGHISPATVWDWTRQLTEDCGLGKVSPHKLRHTCLAQMHDNTEDLRTVAEFARHSDLKTTMGYTRTRRHKLEAAMATLNWLPLDGTAEGA